MSTDWKDVVEQPIEITPRIPCDSTPIIYGKAKAVKRVKRIKRHSRIVSTVTSLQGIRK